MLGRSNDLISDSITRIKNGYSRRLDQVSLCHSNEILQLLEALLQAGYIQNYTVFSAEPTLEHDYPRRGTEGTRRAKASKATFVPLTQQSVPEGTTPTVKSSSRQSRCWRFVNVSLKYYQSLPAIKGIQRLSKPNKRLYFSKKKIIQVSQEQN